MTQLFFALAGMVGVGVFVAASVGIVYLVGGEHIRQQIRDEF